MYWLYIYICRPVGFEGHAFPTAQFSISYGGILWTGLDIISLQKAGVRFMVQTPYI